MINISGKTMPSTAVLAVAGLALFGLTACGDDNKSDGKGAISVSAKDDSCEVSRTKAEAGKITFNVKNDGSKVTEFYVYGDGNKVMGEVEDIGPGLSRKLVVDLSAGKYETACKPGMKGDGIRGDFTVTGKSKKAEDAEIKTAVHSYEEYVEGQTDLLVQKTQEFVNAVKVGDAEKAKTLYPVARTYWESIEPVAEIFGDLDPAIDAREADLEKGDKFTGFHRIEKAMWAENDISQMGPVADQLMKDIHEIVDKSNEVELTPTQLANGSTELLDEIAAPSGKISGEEDIFSGTDMWDIAANLAGSKAALEALQPVLEKRDNALSTEINAKFAAVDQIINKHKVGDGYKFYNQLSEEDKKEIVTAVNALKEKASLVAGVLS